MSLYADIIIDISHEKVDRTFSYGIPAELAGRITIGSEVMVPFGKGSTLRSGYVVGISDTKAYEGEVKEIDSVLENRESIESRQMELAFWMRERYGSTIVRCLKTVLPVKDKVKKRVKKIISLCGDDEKINQLALKLANRHAVAKLALLKSLSEKKEWDLTELLKKHNVSLSSAESLVKDGVAKIEVFDVNRISLPKDLSCKEKVVLNEKQQQVADDIWESYKAGDCRPSLIYGITGSGKTEVYIELIERVINEGKEAIVLIPEISLTYQTISRFYARFGDKVSMLNSKMSAGERFDQFERAKAGKVSVMIGPRSALFTPFRNLGLIVIDEEHEAAYKNENQPRYHATDIAIKLCSMSKAALVLGSATPSMESYSRALDGDYRLYKLESRGNAAKLPEVFVEDMRKELEQGNRSMFSVKLHKEICEALERKEQVMLFINRRGYAGFISCRACGKPVKCPHCDVSLSYHMDNTLKCHYCGYTKPMVKHCPECGSQYIGAFKAGTQAIAEQVKKTFPSAKVLRMDYDTTRNKDGYDKILSAFSRQEADILVGTQMIVKGHDFSNVTVMGILAADSSLFISDYKATERTFQLLTQAAGRAGRGKKRGKVIIQTYQPEHYAVEHASKQDFEGFYKEEMQYRRLLGYPPAAHMLVAMSASLDREKSILCAEEIKKIAKELLPESESRILGPAPATIEKIQDYYRQMLYIKNPSRRVLEELRDRIDCRMKQLQKYEECQIQYDIDPVQLQ